MTLGEATRTFQNYTKFAEHLCAHAPTRFCGLLTPTPHCLRPNQRGHHILASCPSFIMAPVPKRHARLPRLVIEHEPNHGHGPRVCSLHRLKVPNSPLLLHPRSPRWLLEHSLRGTRERRIRTLQHSAKFALHPRAHEGERILGVGWRKGHTIAKTRRPDGATRQTTNKQRRANKQE
jgi:hypothetical protein